MLLFSCLWIMPAGFAIICPIQQFDVATLESVGTTGLMMQILSPMLEYLQIADTDGSASFENWLEQLIDIAHQVMRLFRTEAVFLNPLSHLNARFDLVRAEALMWCSPCVRRHSDCDFSI